MRVLVTGGAGFIGSHLVDHLVAEGHDVAVLDCLTYAGRRANVKVELFETDINDGPRVRDALAAWKPTHIAHLAAETHVCASIEYPRLFIDTNVTGTLSLLEAVRQFPVENFLHVSTDEVYGDLPLDAPVSDAFTEDSPLRPSNPYSASKAAGELLARSYRRTYGLPMVIARPCNNYGPRQLDEKFIPRSIARVQRGLPVELHGDGRQCREWLHVEDCARALALLLEAPSGTYNVGSGVERSNRYVAWLIAGSDVKHVADRPGNDRRYLLDSTKVRAMGWEPRRQFETEVRAMAAAERVAA